MSSQLNNRARLGLQRGQSMTEYMVICAVLVICLFATQPVGQQLAQAIRTFYTDLTLFLSLP
jgi:hypothetical protein